MPALLIAVGALALVLAGIVPISTVLYAGFFGGMLLMHVGGHGGHGGHGGRQDGHRDHAADDAANPGPDAANPRPEGDTGAGRGQRGCH